MPRSPFQSTRTVTPVSVPPSVFAMASGSPLIWIPGDVSFRHRSPGFGFPDVPAPFPHGADAQGGEGPLGFEREDVVFVPPLGFRARQAVRHGPAAASQRLGVYSCRRGVSAAGGVGRRPGAGVHMLRHLQSSFRYPCSSPPPAPALVHLPDSPPQRPGRRVLPGDFREGLAPVRRVSARTPSPRPAGRCHRTLHLFRPVGPVSLGAVKSRSILSSRPLPPTTTSELCPGKCRGRSRPAFLASVAGPSPSQRLNSPAVEKREVFPGSLRAGVRQERRALVALQHGVAPPSPGPAAPGSGRLRHPPYPPW